MTDRTTTTTTGEPATWTLPRPAPVPTRLSAPFWDACKDGLLRYQRCADCGQAVFPPSDFCPADLSAHLVWEESTGHGEIYSYTVVWRPQTPAFEVPYVVAIVELREGYSMLTNIVDTPHEQLRIGLPVSVVFREVSPTITAPFFRATNETASAPTTRS